MAKKILSLLLAALTLLSLAACGGDVKETETGTGTGTETEALSEVIDYISDTEEEYLNKYADMEKYEAWIKTNITDAVYPPVKFQIGGKDSDSLAWSKSISEKSTVIDYADTDMPAERINYTVSFTCDEYKIAVDVLLTEYPGYPVVDYEATIKNLAAGNSPVIKDVYSHNDIIYTAKGDATVYYWNGSSVDGKTDYNEKVKVLEENGKGNAGRLSLEVDNGKPTSTYLPNFNVESESGDGFISILSWQGSWKQILRSSDKGLNLLAGQNNTEFNLLEGESHRLPEMVFIFYKEDQVYGQNIYRRWFWKHNFMREEGFRYGANVLFSTGASGDDIYDVQGTAAYDKVALQAVKAYEFYKQVDRFAQDAGWTEYKGASSWFEAAGNWNVDPVRYPKGLKEIADKYDEMDLDYTLWMEPERAVVGTDLVNEHPEWMIFYKEVQGKNKYFEAKRAGKTASGLVNLGDPDCLKYITDMVNGIIKEQGVDVYRQDFNFFPAPYWEAYDDHMASQLGVKRTGRTEEMYCNGYLAFFDGLLEANPGLNIDACASGGMRYDLATARRAHCHTRTDWYMGLEKAQSDTFTTSKWMMYWGTGFGEYKSDYGIRSRLSLDIGIGVIASRTYDFDTYFKEMGSSIREWRRFNSYMLEDYYPLTDYLLPSQKGLMAFQYDCPSKDSGMVVGYVRGTDIDKNLSLYGLDPDATYEWYDWDDDKNVQTATGKELMEKGFNFKSGTADDYVNDNGVVCVARVYVYNKK